MNNRKILVIGESCTDVYVYGLVERFAPEAPAPVFLELSRKESLGMASNVSRNVKSLGANCDIITNSNLHAITKTRYMDDRTNHMFIRVDVNDKNYGKANLNEILQSLKSYDVIVISDYDKGFLTRSDIVKISQSHPVVLLDTKKILGDWCIDASYIKINAIEFEKSKDLVSDQLLKKLIITRGKNGCIFKDKTFDVENVGIKDVSGAGDTFIAALAVTLSDGGSIEDAIVFANKCATIVVQKRGVSIVNDGVD